MKTRPYFLSAKVVIRNGRGQVLVLRRAAASRHHAGLWEFPGGKADAGESFDAALLREVAEETGVDIVLEHVAGAGSSELDGKTITYLFMEARLVAGEVRLSDEHEEFRWVGLDELLALELCPQFRAFAEEHARSRGFSRVAGDRSAAKKATDDPLDGWVHDFRVLQPAYERLALRVQQVLKSHLARRFVGVMVEARAKAVASFAEKIVRKRKYTDPLRQITDLCGVRVITQIRSEMEEVCAFIRRHFIIDEANSLDTLSRLQNAEFGYRSVHFVAQFREGEFPEVEAELLPLKMEIQVRTVVEHAWASVAHDRLYKSGFQVPDHWQRESARQAAALESANDAFQRMVSGLEEYQTHFGAYLTPEQIHHEIGVCEAVLRHEPGNARQAARRARLALCQDDWDAVERTARAFPHAEKPAELLLCQGIALWERHQAAS
ncbi:MAG: NUDIX domain-containing protein, partial [Verrucomicrobiaceae bacterium]|nr:NUDIX domain-containing protein [Verrucomicrobiaceae bacterium]